MYECGKLKKVLGNKFLFPVILEQCELFVRIGLNFLDKSNVLSNKKNQE